jgi:hypothetical protein
MTQAQSTGIENRDTELATVVAARIKAEGNWATLEWIQAERKLRGSDPVLRGYVEILRVTIVKDFLALSKGTTAVPRLTPDFLNDFARFNLTAQEGYLISQIDGRTAIEKLLKLSPFDPFSTLFSLARMENVRAIEVAE